MLTIERPAFRETPVLLKEFRRLGPCAEISLADFFAGRWERAILEVLESGMEWTPSPPGGAARVAERLLSLLDGH
jgi:hypothetical protein